MTMFGLADCNNFYCSCERVFNPALRTAPVVVLSNNDGCIIARSNEAKALGIDMGAPFYKMRDYLERNKVAVFSSNYTLYGDMSRRVMMLLSDFAPTYRNTPSTKPSSTLPASARATPSAPTASR